MADDVVTNLQINATDNATPVVENMSRRTLDAQRAYERSVRNVQQAERDATVTGTEYFRRRREMMESLNKLEQQKTKDYYDGLRRQAEAEKKHSEELERSAKRAKQSYNEIGDAVSRYARQFAATVVSIDAARRAFVQFGDEQKAFNQLRFNLQSPTREDLQNWKGLAQGLRDLTGLPLEELTNKLGKFQSMTGQTFPDAQKLFSDVALVARSTGISIDDAMQLAANTVRNNLGKSIDEVRDKYKQMAITVPSQMAGAFNQAYDAISKRHSELGINNDKLGVQLGAMAKQLQGQVADPMKTLEALLVGMTDTTTAFGMASTENVDRYKRGQIDLNTLLGETLKLLERQGALGGDDLARRWRAMTGVPEDAGKALQILKNGLREYQIELAKSEKASDIFKQRQKEVGNEASTAWERIKGAASDAGTSIAEAFENVGGVKALQLIAAATQAWNKFRDALGKGGLPLPPPIDRLQKEGEQRLRERMEGQPKGMPWGRRRPTTEAPATFNERFGFATG